MAPEPEHQKAFAFLRRSAIDQHINTRNRWDDLIPVIKKFPDLLGIGLSEDTAIIVKGDTFEVMGSWKVAIHDNTRLYHPGETVLHPLRRRRVQHEDSQNCEAGQRHGPVVSCGIDIS